MKRIVKIVAWVVGIVVVLPLLLSLPAGPIAKSYLNSHGPQLLGRQVSVQHVGLNLLGGSLKVRGLQISEEDGTTPFAGFDTLDVRLHLLALPFHTVHLRHLTLAGLHANLLQDGERFNFSSLVEHLSSSDSTKQTGHSSPWRIRLHNLRLAHARLHYADLQSHKQLTLPDINLRVPDFALGGEQSSQGGLSVAFADGGSLGLDLQYDDALRRYRMDATLQAFSLENLESIVADYLDMDRLRGTLQAHLVADGDVRHLLGSHIGGNVGIDALSLRADRHEVLTLASLRLDINNLNLERNNYNLQRLCVDGLGVEYELFDDGNTIGRLLVQHEQDSTESVDAAPANASATPATFEVGSLQVRRSQVHYVDHTLPDKFDFRVDQIAVDAVNLSSSGINSARLRATLPTGGTVKANWQGRLQRWQYFQLLTLDVDGFDLRQVNPYVVAYTGREFEDGIFGLHTTLRIDQSQLENHNTIDIYKATVGKKRRHFEPRANIPLKTALYLLKDKNDRIMIEMPVSGDISNPEFKYMKAVWKTLGNLLVKVATSPVRGISQALGHGDQELDFLAIDAERQALQSEHFHTLGQLASILQADDNVQLLLARTPGTDSTLDGTIRQYFANQGIADDRLLITTTDTLQRTGYAIGSALLHTEE